MPKKKKKGKKEGKKKGKGGDQIKEGGGEAKPYEPPGPSDKELVLRTELDELNFELGSLKKQVEELRLENDWLQKETEQTRLETHDYQTYVSRKAEKRQSLIVSLSDHNQQRLKEIAQERTELIKDYEEKKAGLKTILLEKDAELSKVQQELKTLDPFKALKNEQDKEIKRLEQLLEEEKFAHENKIRAIKTQYLKEKRALEEEAETKIKEMANSANKEASEFLQRHTQQIRSDNHQLRQELQQLINTTSSLQLQKKKLEKQYKDLLREHEFSQNLRQIRGSVFRGSEASGEVELDLGDRLPGLHQR